MILTILVAALLFTLFVLQRYIACREHSRTHRLLPLMLGIICITDFYQIVEYLTGEHVVFSFLEELLMLQTHYFLMQYIMDVLKIRFRKEIRIFLFVGLIAADISMILAYRENANAYNMIFWLALASYVVTMFYYTVKAYFVRSYSIKERFVNIALFLAIIIPGVGLLAQHIIDRPWGEVIVPVTLCCSCGIVLYLMETQQLADTTTLLIENLYDTSEIAVVLIDQDYYYLDANEAAHRLFAKEFAMLSGKKTRISCKGQLKNLLKNPKEGVEFVARGGAYYQCILQPVTFHNRKKGYILSAVDITKQKQETALMAQLKEMAEEQAVSKSRFMACMSHDLRSPLHAIIGISDIMLGKREVEGRSRSLIRYVKNAGITLLELVNSILLFSKIEAGKLELNSAPYDLEKILEDLTNMCIVNLQNRPVKVSMVIKTEHPSQFLGDEIRVREMLQNLLANAVKYTEQGEIRCELSCRESSKGYELNCMVADTGRGLGSYQLAHVFDEYSSYGEDKESTGLGLFIVRQLAEMMGGSAAAESNGVQGSIFHFTIYQEAAPASSMRPAATFNEEILLKRHIYGTERVRPNWIYPDARVLIVDDMKVNQEILKERLRPWKVMADTAGSGHKAIEAVQKQSYQLILMDHMMPDMSGIEAEEQIQKINRVPTILITADDSDELDDHYQEYGFQALLHKPIDMALFQDALEILIPDTFRKSPEARDAVQQSMEESGYEGNQRGYRRTLEAFVSEAEPLIGEIMGYAMNNHELFQTKVHGIKGASLQVGQSALGESAEIMEMAAKTDNYAYIDRHIESFVEELENALGEVRTELSKMKIQTGMVTPSQEKYSTHKVFQNLREGFDKYDMGLIEDNLRILQSMELSEDERKLADKVQEAYNELEYETGAALLAHFV